VVRQLAATLWVPLDRRTAVEKIADFIADLLVDMLWQQQLTWFSLDFFLPFARVYFALAAASGQSIRVLPLPPASVRTTSAINAKSGTSAPIVKDRELCRNDD